MWKVAIVCLVLVSGALGQSCGAQSGEPSLGQADSSVFPWVGLIYRNVADREEPLVSAMGTLVDQQHVLVPAHVVSSPKLGSLAYVQFGVTDINNAGAALNYTIDKVILHPDYSGGRLGESKNDIALIKLEKPAQFSATMSPVCLPVAGVNYYAEQYHYVSYNTGEPPNPSFQGRKYVSLLPVVSTVNCEEAYKKIASALSALKSASYICAGDEVNDSCRGDSGAPILTKTSAGWTAVGIALFGPARCRTGVPTAFLSVQRYADWINNVTA